MTLIHLASEEIYIVNFVHAIRAPSRSVVAIIDNNPDLVSIITSRLIIARRSPFIRGHDERQKTPPRGGLAMI